MTVVSKESTVQVLSYFDSIPYTCYEVGHCWEPRCTVAFFDTMRDSMKYSLKVYLIFYSATTLLRLRKRKYRTIKEFRKFCLSVLRSSIFLASNGTLFMGSFCLLRKIIGKFYGWHGFLSGFLAGLCSIFLETKSRRSALALYVINLACETFFCIAVARNYITPISYGEVMLFSLASAGFMALYRTREISESLKGPLNFIAAGASEASVQPFQLRTRNPYLLLLKQSTPKHTTCKHAEGCLYYILEGFGKQFAVGYIVELLLNFTRVLRNKSAKKGISSLFKSTSLAKFLAFYALLFKGTNCALRWLTNQDLPSIYGSVAGLFAGTASYFYKSSSVSLYVLFKLFEELTMKGIASGHIPYFANFDCFLFALGLGYLLHTGCVEPHHIQPGYWSFLINVSGRKFPGMFRQLLDVFGTDASRLYPHYVPDLVPKYVMSNDVIKILIANGKWGSSVF